MRCLTKYVLLLLLLSLLLWLFVSLSSLTRTHANCDTNHRQMHSLPKHSKTMPISHRAKTKLSVLTEAVLMRMKKAKTKTSTVTPIRMLQRSMTKNTRVVALTATRRWRMLMERPRPNRRRSWWRGRRRRPRNKCVNRRLMHCCSWMELQIQRNDIWALMIRYT